MKLRGKVTGKLAAFLLFMYPSLALTVKGGMSLSFVLMSLVAIIFLSRHANLVVHLAQDKRALHFSIAMTLPIFATLISQIYHGNLQPSSYDWASRLMFAVPIYLLLRQIPINALAIFQYALPIGAIATLIALYGHPYLWDNNRYTTGKAFDLIHFSHITLLMGMLSLYSINWFERDGRLAVGLKLAGFIVGIYLTFQAGERGSWLAILPLLILWIVWKSNKNYRVTFGVILILGIAIFVAYKFNYLVHYKLTSLYVNISEYLNGRPDSSIGIRLQLWHAAVHLLVENPIFGVGPGQFGMAVQELPSGILTDKALLEAQGDVHNEILAQSVGMGVLGLAFILLLYIVPTLIFYKASQSEMTLQKNTGYIGLCFILGFFIFGLSAETLNLKMSASFFGLTLAVLLAILTTESEAPMLRNKTSSLEEGG